MSAVVQETRCEWNHVSVSEIANVLRAAALENCRDFTIQGGTFNVSTTAEQPQGGEIPQFLPTNPFTVP
jgi:hypothetical protein